MRTIHAAPAGAGFWLLLATALGAPPGLPAPAQLGAFTHADVLLVVAPHPDDESLCCAGAIERARAAGARVALVWITSGDAFELDAHVVERRLFTKDKDLLELATLRMREAGRVADLLGIAPDERFFLGYPDRGLTRLLHENFDTPYRSSHTGAAAVPYRQALAAGAAYTGRNLERDFTSVIERVKPTWLLAPSPLDEHEDHRATAELVMRVLGSAPTAVRARYWIVRCAARRARPAVELLRTLARGAHGEGGSDPPLRNPAASHLIFHAVFC